MRILTVWLMTLLIGIPAGGSAADAAAGLAGSSGKSATFRIFNAMLYTDMPNIGQRLSVVYESTFYPSGQQQKDGTPTEPGIVKAARSAKRQIRRSEVTKQLVAIDVERWPVWPFATGDDHTRSIARYANVARRFAKAIDKPICLYGIFPEAGINQAVQSLTDLQMLKQWQAASDETARMLTPIVSAMCPALYSYYDSDDPTQARRHLEDWKVFVRQTIAEARRIAPGMPVYPFVWPQYHRGGSVQDDRFVKPNVWREQLKSIRQHADGLILWGGWNFVTNKPLSWDPKAPWFEVFREVFPR